MELLRGLTLPDVYGALQDPIVAGAVAVAGLVVLVVLLVTSWRACCARKSTAKSTPPRASTAVAPAPRPEPVQARSASPRPVIVARAAPVPADAAPAEPVAVAARIKKKERSASSTLALTLELDDGLTFFRTRGPEQQLEHLEKLSVSRTRLPRAFPAVPLTPEELEVVARLKARIAEDKLPVSATGNHASTDSFIGRFVRGKRNVESKAYEQLRACLLWREREQIDTLPQWYRTKFADSAARLDAYYPWQDHGVDNNGVPVTWDRLPSMDFKVLMGAFTADELIHWHLDIMERRSELLARKGVYGGIFVEDFAELSMAHWYKPAVDMLKIMMHVDSQNYPEFSTAIFYVNAPRVLTVLWGMLKGLMDPVTVNKVHISGDGGAEALSRFMPSSSIPREYGGTCTTCPGDRCLDYTKGGPFLSTPDKPITTVTVAAKAERDVQVGTLKAGAMLEWSFKCAADDIDATLLRLDGDDGAGQPVKAVGRVTEHSESIEVDKAGVYVVRYGNVYSYWKDKRIGHFHRVK